MALLDTGSKACLIRENIWNICWELVLPHQMVIVPVYSTGDRKPPARGCGRTNVLEKNGTISRGSSKDVLVQTVAWVHVVPDKGLTVYYFCKKIQRHARRLDGGCQLYSSTR